MGIQSQKYGFGQTVERRKFNLCVKQLETRLYKRKIKNFNNWYFGNCKSCLGNGVVFKHIPATSTVTDKISRKYITTRDGKKKIPKAAGLFTLKKL